MIKLKYQSVFNELEDLTKFREIVLEAHNRLHGIPLKEDAISDWSGWLELPAETDVNKKLVDRIVRTRRRLKRQGVDVLVVLGTGGSFLGTRAVYDFIHPPYKKIHEDQVELVFLGYTMNERHIKAILHYLKDKNFAVNVISRSGKTLEVKVVFKLLMKMLKERYITDSELNKRLLITTTEGSPLQLETKAGEKSGPEFYEIPANIGGRYSTLTAVGLLPLGIADIKINKLLEGAFAAYEELLYPVPQNPAYLYACSRAALYSWAGMTVELGVIFEPSMDYFMKWWRSIFAESEGKNGWGLFPAIALYTSELHSLGQWMQQGDSELTFETFHVVRQDGELFVDEKLLTDEDKFLATRSVGDMEYSILRGVLDAHEMRVFTQKKKEVITPVPHIVFEWSDYTEKTIGYAMYYLQKSAAMYCLLCEINPFDQPGVEAYKTESIRYIQEGYIYEEEQDVILDYKPPVVDLEELSDEELEEVKIVEEAREDAVIELEEESVVLEEIEETEETEEKVKKAKKGWFKKGKKPAKEVDEELEEMEELEEETFIVTEEVEEEYIETLTPEERSSYASTKASSRVVEDVEDVEEYQEVLVATKKKKKVKKEQEIEKRVSVVEDEKRVRVGVEEIGEIRITIKPKRKLKMKKKSTLSNLTQETKEEAKKPTAKKAAPKKTTAKKPAAKKAAPKKVEAKKPAAKKPATKKATPKKVEAKKPAAKKAAPKKVEAKKAPAKKAAPKKVEAKKAPAKKAAPKKVEAKKAPAKKAAPKKVEAKKAPAKKAPAKKSSPAKIKAKTPKKISVTEPNNRPKRKKVVVKSSTKGYARSGSNKPFSGVE